MLISESKRKRALKRSNITNTKGEKKALEL